MQHLEPTSSTPQQEQNGKVDKHDIAIVIGCVALKLQGDIANTTTMVFNR